MEATASGVLTALCIQLSNSIAELSLLGNISVVLGFQSTSLQLCKQVREE